MKLEKATENQVTYGVNLLAGEWRDPSIPSWGYLTRQQALDAARAQADGDYSIVAVSCSPSGFAGFIGAYAEDEDEQDA